MPAAAALMAEAELPLATVGADTAEPGEDMLTLIDIRSSSSSEGEGKVSNTLLNSLNLDEKRTSTHAPRSTCQG